MSKLSETNSFDSNEPILKNQFAQDNSSQSKQKLLEEALQNLFSSPQKEKPFGDLKDTTILLDDKTSGKHVLKIHTVTNVFHQNDDYIDKRFQTKNIQNSEKFKDKESHSLPPRYFIQDMEGNITEHPYPAEKQTK